MQKGKVKWFDSKKGYGFILNPQEGEDIFVHYSSIVSDNDYKMLSQGMEVDFDMEITEKGLQAKNVREIVTFLWT